MEASFRLFPFVFLLCNAFSTPYASTSDAGDCTSSLEQFSDLPLKHLCFLQPPLRMHTLLRRKQPLLLSSTKIILWRITSEEQPCSVHLHHAIVYVC